MGTGLAGIEQHEGKDRLVGGSLPEVEVGLLARLEQLPPKLPEVCECQGCREGMDRDAVVVLARVGSGFSVSCYNHAPVPMDSRHLSWNRCWRCMRPMLLHTEWYWAPFCCGAHQLLGPLEVAPRTKPTPRGLRLSQAAA